MRSVDVLDTPLHQVTFCVVDLETTGGSAGACSITEVGAARFRGGECLGTFQTLVNPGGPIAPTVTALTGITAAMVSPAPPVSAVLPALTEFVGGAVLVGHNVRFDVSFLDAALVAGERARVGLHRVDTMALARRLVRDEVPDCRLSTLAHHLRLDHQPTHRALDDVLATADLLHALLERAATFGATALDDLLSLPRLAGHAQGAKLRLTRALPRVAGVYVLRDGQGRALDVGHAANLRRDVRGLFSGDDARATGPLLRQVQAIEHRACASPLEAQVTAIRLGLSLQPRRSPGRSGHRYVKLRGRGAPRLSIARAPGADSARYLGPLPSATAARQVIDAVAALAPHRSGVAQSAGDSPGGAPVCDLSLCDVFDRPASVLAGLHGRMVAARDAGRYAHAAVLREMGRAVADAVDRQHRFDALRRAGRMVVEVPGEGGVELNRGRLVRTWSDDGQGPGQCGVGSQCGPTLQGGTPSRRATAADGDVPHQRHAAADEAGRRGATRIDLPPDDGPLPADMADELGCVAAWLDANAHRLRLVHVDGGLACDLPALPSFDADDADDLTRPGDLAERAPGPARRHRTIGLRCAAC